MTLTVAPGVAWCPLTQRLTQTTSSTFGLAGARTPPEEALAASAADGSATAAAQLAASGDQEAGMGVHERPLFLGPAGLAVGLALKELRYGLIRFAPGDSEVSNWVPRSLAAVPGGIRRVSRNEYT